jgi:hypothetical protein
MANEELVKSYRANQEVEVFKFLKRINNPFLFRLFMLIKLPMAFLASIKVKSANAEFCEITVPYRWLNQNPFGSTYFAVMAMAAEMSSGMIALMYTMNSKPSVAMLVTNLEAKFIKKALGLTTFRCDSGAQIRESIERSIITGEGQSVTCNAKGYSKDGVLEAEFDVTWSFKARKSS